MANKLTTDETKNLTVNIPTKTHTQAKTVTAALGLTWDEAVAVALSRWAISEIRAVTDAAKGGSK
jgi:antitoxin component of RelBE/YafQ-DinJ toxin-antitoxin module